MAATKQSAATMNGSAPMKRKLTQKHPVVRVVMDGIDWVYEIGDAANGTKVYPNRRCLEDDARHPLIECGIAVVDVKFVRWIRKPRLP